MPPCLTLSMIRYRSRVKWSNPRKWVAPFPTPWCSSYRTVSLRVTLGYGRQLYYVYIYRRVGLYWYIYIYIYIYVYTYIHMYTHTYIYVHTHTHTFRYAYTRMYTYVYSFIYICTYCHPQTYCFVVSQLFSVARTLEAGIETHPTLR